MSDGSWVAPLVGPVKKRKGRATVLIDGVPLSVPQRAADIALTKRPAGPGTEHEVVGLREPRGELVADHDQRQLSRDRHCPSGAIGLGRPALSLAINLPRELDLGIVKIVQLNVRPGDGE